MKTKTIIFTLLLGISALCASCTEKAFDIEKLIIDVFDPQSGENVLILVDTTNDKYPDHAAWAERREMAWEWHQAFKSLSQKRNFTVFPLMTFPASGAHNGPLPVSGIMDGEEIAFDEILSQTNILVALTEYSATAPLIEYAQQFPQLRVASMPGVSPAMQNTALAVDHDKMADRCNLIEEVLQDAVGARVLFVTGHQMYFDLRYRQPEVDAGILHQDTPGLRVINLPSGETFIAPYEGEREGIPSETHGVIPIQCDWERVKLEVRANQVTEVKGPGPCARWFREFFETDEARRNIAELGFGCNDQAVLTGNVLEDEKVYGIHLAIGRSDHIGGAIGPEDFTDPSHVTHMDFVYSLLDGDMWPIDVNLFYEDGSNILIIRDNEYVIFK